MTLRVGVIGYGLAGRFFHAPMLKGCGFDVVGIVTTNPQRTAEARSDFPKTQICVNVGELLRLGLDLLVVASANVAHAADAIAGLSSGVPVVVDKPMGRTVKETQEILLAAKQNKTPITTYFNRLYDSDTLTIQKILNEGILGNVFRLDSRFEKFRPESNPASWRENNSVADGGGNLLDLGPHLVSTALRLFGPAELSFASVRNIRGRADDDIALTLKHESGVDSYLSASSIIGAGGPRIRLSGSSGSLVIKDLDKQESMLRTGSYPAGGAWGSTASSTAIVVMGEQEVEYPAVPGNYAQFYKEVETAIHGDGAWPVSENEALAVAKIIEEAREISIR